MEPEDRKALNKWIADLRKQAEEDEEMYCEREVWLTGRRPLAGREKGIARALIEYEEIEV
jgi:hypothetical protein